jgi:hypothetical protein
MRERTHRLSARILFARNGAALRHLGEPLCPSGMRLRGEVVSHAALSEVAGPGGDDLPTGVSGVLSGVPIGEFSRGDATVRSSCWIQAIGPHDTVRALNDSE